MTNEELERMAIRAVEIGVGMFAYAKSQGVSIKSLTPSQTSFYADCFANAKSQALLKELIEAAKQRKQERLLKSLRMSPGYRAAMAKLMKRNENALIVWQPRPMFSLLETLLINEAWRRSEFAIATKIIEQAILKSLMIPAC